MTALTKQNISDLVALQLEGSGLAEQVTSLELLELFETVAGFWPACVAMITPTSEDLSAIHEDQSRNGEWFQGSMEQVLEARIRDGSGRLTSAFCDWFDRYCCYDASIRSRPFLQAYTRPAEFTELPQNQTEVINSETRPRRSAPSGGRSPSQQLQTKFACVVIEQMNPPSGARANEIYPDFARLACQVADDETWGQELTAEIESGTGYLVISYTTIGKANRVKKSITPKRLRALLARRRSQRS